MEKAREMQRKTLKLKPERITTEVEETILLKHATRQSFYPDPPMRRSVVVRSSSPRLRTHNLLAPTVNLRSRSEGNLVAGQIRDSNSQLIYKEQNERSFQLPKLPHQLQDAPLTTGPIDRNRQLKQKDNLTTGKKTISSTLRVNESRTFATRQSPHLGLLKQHLEQEESKNLELNQQTKRESLLRWLSEQHLYSR